MKEVATKRNGRWSGTYQRATSRLLQDPGLASNQRQDFYFVDKKLTMETHENIRMMVLARFERERRAFVRRTSIEDEATEDNNLN